MEAKYIGFAKKRTFLAAALEDQKVLDAQTTKSAQDLYTSVLASFGAGVATLEVAFTHDIKKDDPLLHSDADTKVTYGEDFPTQPFVLHLDDIVSGNEFGGYVWVRAPNAGVPVSSHAASLVSVGPISSLFDSGAISVDMSSSVEVFGPFTSIGQRSQAALKAQAYAGARVFTGVLSGATASTGADWTNLAKGTASARTGKTPGPGYSGSFIIRYSANMTVAFSGQTLTASGETWDSAALLDPGNYDLVKTIPMDWSNNVVSGATTASGTVPPDNVATQNSAPGSTSKVGAPVTQGRSGPQ